MPTSPPSDIASARLTNGRDRHRAVDGAGGQGSLEDHLAAGKVAAVGVDVDAGELGLCQFSIVHLVLLSLRSPVQLTMKGSTDLSTSGAPAGTAKAPSGVIDSPSSVFSVAAWRPSTLWIESAAESTSGPLMFAA